VDNDVRPKTAEGLGDNRTLGDVALDHAKSGRRVRQVVATAGCVVVDDEHLVAARQEPIGKV
jgi:hypothetical protein